MRWSDEVERWCAAMRWSDEVERWCDVIKLRELRHHVAVSLNCVGKLTTQQQGPYSATPLVVISDDCRVYSAIVETSKTKALQMFFSVIH